MKISFLHPRQVFIHYRQKPNTPFYYGDGVSENTQGMYRSTHFFLQHVHWQLSYHQRHGTEAGGEINIPRATDGLFPEVAFLVL